MIEESDSQTPRYWIEQLKFKMNLPSTGMRKVADKANVEAFDLDRLNLRLHNPSGDSK